MQSVSARSEDGVRRTIPYRMVAVVFALAASDALAVAPASTSAVHVARYALVSKGVTVGHVQATRSKVLREGRECVQLRVHTEVKVDLLIFRYSLKSEETWVTDPAGLIAYGLTSVEDGRRKTISGESHGGFFRFDINEEGRSRTWEVPRSAYDYAGDDSPAQLPGRAGEVKTFRVLSPGDLAVVGRSYRWVSSESVTVGDRKVICRVVDVEDPSAKVRRWFTVDELGLLLLREEAREKRGSYSMRVTSMETAGGAP